MKELIRHILREHTREIGESKKLTTPEFIERAKEIHGDKYDYSKVDYKGATHKIEIICPDHGKFSQSPYSHLSGRGCPKCAGTEKRSTEKFIEDAKKIHGDKYDYSNVDYKSNRIPVKIICPEHGPFQQTPSKHLSSNYGCPECALTGRSNNRKTSSDDFIKNANEVHNNKYNYSQVDYKNTHSKVEIICPEHGSFFQEPAHHLQGRGCPQCAGNVKYSNQIFIDKANEIHKGKYLYNNLDYQGANKKVTITCPKHGDFSQVAASHLQGIGCPYCQESKGAIIVRSILKKIDIPFIEEKKFQDCRNTLKGRACVMLPFDFYLPNNNTIIEYDGVQHFKPSFGEKSFEITTRNDKQKNKYCKKNGIKLIRIPYTMKKEDIEPYILKELGL